MPGSVVLHLAGDAADLRRGGHLGVEELDVRRPALQEEQHDRFVLDRPARAAGRGSRGGRPADSGKLKSAEQAQAADAEELAAAKALAVAIEGAIEQREHDDSPTLASWNWHRGVTPGLPGTTVPRHRPNRDAFFLVHRLVGA